MNRFYSTKQAMGAQVTTLQELVVDIPLVEPDTERFVQMIKAEMFLAEEALNWVSEEPEFLKNVLACISYTFSDTYIKQFKRNKLSCPKSLKSAVQYLIFSGHEFFELAKVEGKNIYSTHSYTHFWLYLDDMLEEYRFVECLYPDIDCKLDPKMLPELDKAARAHKKYEKRKEALIETKEILFD